MKKDQSAHTTTRAVSVEIYIYIHIYIHTYTNFKTINNVLDERMVLKTHLFIKIFRLLYRCFVFIYSYRKPLGCVFMLVTLTLSKPHEIRTIEMGIGKIGESDINFWLHSFHPLLLFATFVMNSFPLPKRRTFWMA